MFGFSGESACKVKKFAAKSRETGIWKRFAILLRHKKVAKGVKLVGDVGVSKSTCVSKQSRDALGDLIAPRLWRVAVKGALPPPQPLAAAGFTPKVFCKR
ncbi:MAG: hypothetical protein QGI70_00620 [Paracoccaceae bacterium]|nr:hypothetical protein [Paracoccaceae bacterium]